MTSQSVGDLRSPTGVDAEFMVRCERQQLLSCVTAVLAFERIYVLDEDLNYPSFFLRFLFGLMFAPLFSWIENKLMR